MKKINQLLLSVATVLAMAACNSDDNWYNEKWTDTTSTTASDDDNTQTTTTVNDVVNGVSTTGDVLDADHLISYEGDAAHDEQHRTGILRDFESRVFHRRFQNTNFTISYPFSVLCPLPAGS